MEYIERETVEQIIAAQCGECADACLEFDGIQPDCNQCLLHGAAKAIKTIPAADVRPVVLCGVCELHGHCYTEDVFAFARLAEENRFCAFGKVKTNGEKREES